MLEIALDVNNEPIYEGDFVRIQCYDKQGAFIGLLQVMLEWRENQEGNNINELTPPGTSRVEIELLERYDYYDYSDTLECGCCACCGCSCYGYYDDEDHGVDYEEDSFYDES